MSDSPIHIVTLADERYAIPLAVLGRSIAETLGVGATAILHVIDGGIGVETKERLRASWDSGRVRLEFLTPRFGQKSELPVWGRLPALTYARVYVPELLPSACAKAIFLDSDVVVVRDLSRLWDIDLDGKGLLAAQDPAIPYVSSEGGLESFGALGIPAGSPYFNAGVMVMNLDKWRRTGAPERVMAYIHSHAGELNYCDQDGINAVFWDDWGELDPRWQVQPCLAARPRIPLLHRPAEAWIYHCSGRLKPWLYRGGNAADRRFYELLDRTCWRGWRPPRTLQSVLYRLYDSPVRDWLYPLERWGHRQLRNSSRRSAGV